MQTIQGSKNVIQNKTLNIARNASRSLYSEYFKNPHHLEGGSKQEKIMSVRKTTLDAQKQHGGSAKLRGKILNMGREQGE